MRRIIEQNSRLGIIIVIITVVRLCPLCPWLTFVFGTKMANVTLNAFNLHEKDELQGQYCIKRRQHTHGSVLSHLSLEALHREQDRVNLRTPDSKPEEALVLASPSFVL